MSLSHSTEAKVQIVTGIFMIAFLIAGCFSPWQALGACVVMLVFVAWLLNILGRK